MEMRCDAAMDALNEKIREAEQFRDRYYEYHPGSKFADKSKAVREKVIPLLQDIPLEIRGSSSLSAEHSLLCGRILNICMEYDPKCEKHLTQAVKLNPYLAEAWKELGECLWKKNDHEAAIDCFKKSLSRERTAKCMCALSSALRQHALMTTDKKKRDEMREEAARLCAEAVRVDSDSGTAWHALGNSHLTDFFAKGQIDEQIMKNAREAYEKALTLGDEYLSADLHLNYATALKFDQDYRKCLEHLHIACTRDPEFFDAKERYEGLCIFLARLSEAVERKGKLKTKRLLEFQKSLSQIEPNRSRAISMRLADGEKRTLKEADFGSIREGLNEDVVIVGKVVGVVPNPDAIPFAFVGCDKNGTCLAFTVYNFSQNFGMIIGDLFSLADPFVIDVDVNEIHCGRLSADHRIKFRAVRIQSPHVLLKNGKRMSLDCVAPCEIASTYTL
uniref:Tetratricopeptide repeat protein 5 OB fold domain-containing protein n=1 Tax=Parascaris univalens TaxID=6257 RepID=A0A914ZXA2_PARUN